MYEFNVDKKMTEYKTNEKEALKILVEVVTAKREAEIVRFLLNRNKFFLCHILILKHF